MNDLPSFHFPPIGHVQSPFRQKFGTPRQSGLVDKVPGRLVFDPSRVPTGSLEGLASFSHLWVLFYFHLNQPHLNKGKVSPPRLKGEKRGVLATRSPHRPNSIGLSLVEILAVHPEENYLEIAGHDLTDGTPVLDVKPFIPDYDQPAAATRGWLPEVDDTKLSVFWSDEAERQSQTFALTARERGWIEASLAEDIRSRYDRERHDKKFYWHFMDWDICFRCEGQNLIIEALQSKPQKQSFAVSSETTTNTQTKLRRDIKS